MSSHESASLSAVASAGSRSPTLSSAGRLSPRSRRVWISTGFVVMGILTLAAVTAYATFLFGRVEGVEFTADAFSRRKFVFYEIPFIRIQASGIDRSDSTGPVEQFVISKKLVQLIQPSSTQPSLRWDLVSARKAGSETAFGEAGILCRYFDMRDAEGGHVWLAWSEKHPELARVIWPEVQKLAAKQLYVLIPALFQFARQAVEPDGFSLQIAQFLAERILWLADTERELGNHQRAVDLYTLALEYQPQLRAAWEGRAAAYETLNEPQKAQQDRLQGEKVKTQSESPR